MLWHGHDCGELGLSSPAVRLSATAHSAHGARASSVNHKKFRRLYREERLQVRRRGGAQAGAGHAGTDDTAARCPISTGAWISCRSAFADGGRRFRILAIVDDFTRECLALVPDTSLPGVRVVRELNTLITSRGRPLMCVSDNGSRVDRQAMRPCAAVTGSTR